MNKSWYGMGFRIRSTALHSAALTTMQLHYFNAFHGAALHNSTALHCTPTTPLHFAALCNAIQRISPALKEIALHCTVQCSTLHCISQHLTSTTLH